MGNEQIGIILDLQVEKALNVLLNTHLNIDKILWLAVNSLAAEIMFVTFSNRIHTY